MRKMRIEPSGRVGLAKLQARCNAWNLENQVRAVVLVRLDSGANIITRTRSPAEILSGHSAVIWVDGVSGCYHLDRVTPAHRLKLDYR